MNIAELKLSLNLGSSLMMVEQLSQDTKAPTGWVTSWDNTTRTRVAMHKDVFAKVIADKSFNGLAAKSSTETAASGKEYTLHVVIIPNNVLGVL